jgi:hypothetical protein
MRRVLVLGGVLLAGSLICRADIVTFNFQGAIGDGYSTTTAAGSASGTVTIDTATGLATGLDVSANTTSANYLGVTSATFTSISSQGVPPYANYNEIVSTQGGYYLYLLVPDASLIGYSGGELCSYDSADCNIQLSDYLTPTSGVAFVSASLTPEVAATPEPSSLALLGSGALGLAGVLRRKRF